MDEVTPSPLALTRSDLLHLLRQDWERRPSGQEKKGSWSEYLWNWAQWLQEAAQAAARDEEEAGHGAPL